MNNGHPAIEVVEHRRGRKIGLWLVLFVLLLLGYLAVSYLELHSGLSPVVPLSPAVLVPKGSGGAVYQLSSQFHTTSVGRGATRTTTTRTLIDLWAFDANDLQPRWRRRLSSERNGSFDARVLLGAQGDYLWLFSQGDLQALRQLDGGLEIDSAGIQARNPQLRDRMPQEQQYLRLDANGLGVTASDGSEWLIEVPGFAARPRAAAVPAEVSLPVYYSPASDTFMARGLPIPDHWLGLLNEEEARSLESENRLPDQLARTRVGLWGARVRESGRVFGSESDFHELKQLTAAGDFLQGGLLRAYQPRRPGALFDPVRSSVIWLREPDSVLVLDRDRLGEQGRLRITRVRGPEGDIVWQVALPLSLLNSVTRMDGKLLLAGQQYTPAPDSKPRDPAHHVLHRLVLLDLVSGSQQVFNGEEVDAHPPAQGD